MWLSGECAGRRFEGTCSQRFSGESDSRTGTHLSSDSGQSDKGNVQLAVLLADVLLQLIHLVEEVAVDAPGKRTSFQLNTLGREQRDGVSPLLHPRQGVQRVRQLLDLRLQIRAFLLHRVEPLPDLDVGEPVDDDLVLQDRRHVLQRDGAD